MTLLRLVIIVLAVSLVSFGRARADTPSFNGGPFTAGINVAVFSGGSIDEAVAAAPGAESFWTAVGGRLIGYRVGAPTFVNSSFLAAFPGGNVGAGTIMIVLLSGEPSGSPPRTNAPDSATTCSISTASRAAISSTVKVTTSAGGVGTAFYIGGSEFLTAAHVVSGETSVTLASDLVTLTARVTGVSPALDVAILTATTTLKPLMWGDSRTLTAGDSVVVAGYAAGLGTSAGVTSGLVSRTFEDGAGTTIIQTDAAVSPGNSGGPVVDLCGRVLGLVSSKLVGLGVEGIGFAIAETDVRATLSLARSNAPAPLPTGPPPRPTLPDEPLAHDTTAESVLFASINEERAAVGLPALTLDPELVALSRAHSRDMIERDFFAHTNPDGEDPFDRMHAAGVEFGYAAENIVAGQSGASAHATLMASAPHRANILGERYTRVGIGAINRPGGGVIVTEMFVD